MKKARIYRSYKTGIKYYAAQPLLTHHLYSYKPNNLF